MANTRTDIRADIDGRKLMRMINADFISTALVAFLGTLGFDTIFIDCEHGFASIRDVDDLVRAAQGAGMLALIRPETKHPAILERYLDTGTDGLILPHVESADELENTIAIARDARFRDADELVIFALIETLEGIDKTAEICAVDGLRGVLLGPSDLSKSMGLHGQLQHPDVQAVIARARPIVLAAGLRLSVGPNHPALADPAGEERYMTYAHANALLAGGAAAYLAQAGQGA